MGELFNANTPRVSKFRAFNFPQNQAINGKSIALGKPNAFFTRTRKQRIFWLCLAKNARRTMHKPAQLSTRNASAPPPQNSMAGVLPDVVPSQRNPQFHCKDNPRSDVCNARPR
jgi:hypothetical protein